MAIPEFSYVIYIETSPDQLWKALTQPEFTRLYWGVGLQSDWTEGATIYWHDDRDPDGTFVDLGMRVLAADPGRALSYSWHTYLPEDGKTFGWTDAELTEACQERSTVSFRIDQSGSMAKLTLVHDDFDRPDSKMLESIRDGWPSVLSRLKTLLETGRSPDGTHREWWRRENLASQLSG